MRIPFAAALATLVTAQPVLACMNAMSEAPVAEHESFSPALLLPAALLVLAAGASGFLVWRLSRPSGAPA